MSIELSEQNLNNSHWITSEVINEKQYLTIPKNMYIGIDFGTSTTVVSRATVNNYKVIIESIKIAQPDEFGASIRHHLINSVISWKNKTLIWGQDAYRLKPLLIEGRTVFSSFKMRLGLSIGPTYPETRLPQRQELGWVVETAADATREFLKGILNSLKEELGEDRLDRYRFALSVPASFEANQRRDLMKSLHENGITENQCCLIDEPNAAFLSFMYDCTQKKVLHPLIERLSKQRGNILVYDFGAGTCDISILQVDTRNNQFTSRNLAISKFTALGGDDIDRAIAAHVLLPQLLKSSPNYDPNSRDIKEKIIPRLQATAEKLKISATRWIINKKIADFDSLNHYLDIDFEDLPVENIKVKPQSLSLIKPKLTIREFKAILVDFVGDFDGIYTPMHLLSPVIDALDKAKLSREEIDAVLFIGGSCLNPLVQSCVMSYMNEFEESVESIVPIDLRSHVSLGTAIHSFSYHGLGLDFIKPITSESIFIIVRNNNLETIIPASSEVPTTQPFKTNFIVSQENQTKIELPICVGSKNKLLGILTIEAGTRKFFDIGAQVKVLASINHEKLLSIKATINGITAETSILNPLANEELTRSESSMLKAKQTFNQALLDYDGRPPSSIAIQYSKACLDAGAYELAADLYIAIERLDPLLDFSTLICFAYAKAKKYTKSNEWAKKAYKRKPNAVNAYNLSCKEVGSKKEEYLRISLDHNEYFNSALITLGNILHERGDPEGQELLERALISYRSKIDYSLLEDCDDIIKICDTLGKYEELKETAKKRKENFTQDESELYSSDYLVESIKPSIEMKKD